MYNVLPREWCHRWRKYIKSGEGGMPEAPDASGEFVSVNSVQLLFILYACVKYLTVE